ncbi:MAG TPA: hypothetical protein VJ570_09585 [Holophagaceae bacterium]|nr:hypothetical protein [Holophagaceae bacterium]
MEVWGASILGCIEGLAKAGLPRDVAMAILAQGGVAAVDPEGWYPQQPYLDMFKAIEARYGDEALRAMAGQVPDTSAFPPGIKTLEQALQGLDIAYQLNHRGGRIGHYACMPLGPRALEMVCENPYGCAFDLGILDALIRAFRPKGSKPSILHEAGTPCRRRGGGSCTYQILW